MKQIKFIGFSLLVMVALLSSAPLTAQTFQPETKTGAIQSQKILKSGAAYNGTVYEPFGSSTPSSQSYTPAKAPGTGPRRTSEYPGWHQDESGNWVPDNEEDYGGGVETSQSSQFPLGDAVWPLMALALMFCGYIAIRRKRNALNC